MFCVLRVVGKELNRSAIAQAIEPNVSFRSSDCVNFDVAEANTKSELHKGIIEFMVRNEAAIEKLKSNLTVTDKNLDIGVIVDEDQASKTFDLDDEFIARAHNLGLTVSVSFYKGAKATKSF